MSSTHGFFRRARSLCEHRPDHNERSRLSAASALAERGGFEPPVQNNPYGSLANYWFKPLTHLSKVSHHVRRGGKYS